jgi:hypothetical protein
VGGGSPLFLPDKARSPPRTPGFVLCGMEKVADGHPLWITLGTVLAQLDSYPHKTAMDRSCCLRAPPFVQTATQTLQLRNPAPALNKLALSTESGLLYYYCYLYIEL